MEERKEEDLEEKKSKEENSTSSTENTKQEPPPTPPWFFDTEDVDTENKPEQVSELETAYYYFFRVVCSYNPSYVKPLSDLLEEANTKTKDIDTLQQLFITYEQKMGNEISSIEESIHALIFSVIAIEFYCINKTTIEFYCINKTTFAEELSRHQLRMQDILGYLLNQPELDNYKKYGLIRLVAATFDLTKDFLIAETFYRMALDYLPANFADSELPFVMQILTQHAISACENHFLSHAISQFIYVLHEVIKKNNQQNNNPALSAHYISICFTYLNPLVQEGIADINQLLAIQNALPQLKELIFTLVIFNDIAPFFSQLDFSSTLRLLTLLWPIIDITNIEQTFIHFQKIVSTNFEAILRIFFAKGDILSSKCDWQIKIIWFFLGGALVKKLEALRESSAIAAGTIRKILDCMKHFLLQFSTDPMLSHAGKFSLYNLMALVHVSISKFKRASFYYRQSLHYKYIIEEEKSIPSITYQPLSLQTSECVFKLIACEYADKLQKGKTPEDAYGKKMGDIIVLALTNYLDEQEAALILTWMLHSQHIDNLHYTDTNLSAAACEFFKNIESTLENLELEREDAVNYFLNKIADIFEAVNWTIKEKAALIQTAKTLSIELKKASSQTAIVPLKHNSAYFFKAAILCYQNALQKNTPLEEAYLKTLGYVSTALNHASIAEANKIYSCIMQFEDQMAKRCWKEQCFQDAAFHFTIVVDAAIEGLKINKNQGQIAVFFGYILQAFDALHILIEKNVVTSEQKSKILSHIKTLEIECFNLRPQYAPSYGVFSYDKISMTPIIDKLKKSIDTPSYPLLEDGKNAPYFGNVL
jgi:hypothetical protein